MPSQRHQADLYDVLGVTSRASVEEIKQRYKFLILAFHPDRYARNPEHRHQAEEAVKQVTEAYRVLSDSSQRTRYDYTRQVEAHSSPTITGTEAWLHSYGQLQDDLERTRSRLHQVEGELRTARGQIERLVEEKSSVERRAAESERSLDSEIRQHLGMRQELTERYEQLARTSQERETLLDGQREEATRRANQLTEELAGREKLMDQLRKTQAQRKHSSESRMTIVTQQMQRLELRLAERETELLQLRATQQALEVQLGQETRSTELSLQISRSLQTQQNELPRIAGPRDRLRRGTPARAGHLAPLADRSRHRHHQRAGALVPAAPLTLRVPWVRLRAQKANQHGTIRPMARQLTEKLAQKLDNLPGAPGCYQMHNADGKVIYVGKAVVLRNRVRSYFHSSAQHSPKTQALVDEIADITWWVTKTELEALILENELIKRYKPHYNIRLKDDRTYPYIKITWQEDYPRVAGRAPDPEGWWALFRSLHLQSRLLSDPGCLAPRLSLPGL